MKKPENWYGFKVKCDLYDFGISNMTPESHQQYCKRTGGDGKDRPRWEGSEYYGPLRCHWNVCPKLKKQRKAGGFKGWDIMGKELQANQDLQKG